MVEIGAEQDNFQSLLGYEIKPMAKTEKKKKKNTFCNVLCQKLC